MNLPDGIESIQNVCELQLLTTPGAESARPDLLFEISHGATQRSHYETIRGMLSPDLPDDLIDYFFVNTDVGSTEYARRVAEIVTESGSHSVLILRCLLPRTFIDTNRIIGADTTEAKGARLTTAMAEYIRDPGDAEKLLAMYQQYHDVAARAYEWICGAGGLAMMPHTYAPRSIQIDSFDEGIGRALRKAYEPEHYEKWAVRPAIDIISECPDGENLSPRSLVRSIRKKYAEIGIEVAENATYQLHPISMAHHYSLKYPGQVLCIEIARDRLADPFSPFEEMHISDKKVSEIANPTAAAFVEQLGP